MENTGFNLRAYRIKEAAINTLSTHGLNEEIIILNTLINDAHPVTLEVSFFVQRLRRRLGQINGKTPTGVDIMNALITLENMNVITCNKGEYLKVTSVLYTINPDVCPVFDRRNLDRVNYPDRAVTLPYLNSER